MRFVTYLFWPRPVVVEYSDPKVMTMLGVCFGMIIAALLIRRWRRGVENTVTRRLSRSWSKAGLWFGILGIFMIICRAEDIHYLAMRFWWVVWGLVLAIYLLLQIKIWRARHYEKLPVTAVEDPRSKYLPGKHK